MVISLAAEARDVKAVLHLKDPATLGAAQPFVEVYNLRINGQTKLLIGTASSYDKKEYDRLSAAKFEELTQIATLPDDPDVKRVYRAGAGVEQAYCYPANARPLSDGVIHANALQTAPLTGEFVLAGKKVQRQVTFGEIDLLLFVDPSEPLENSVYAWATREQSVAAWQEFARAFPQSRRATAAGDNLARAFLSSVQQDWTNFQDRRSPRYLRSAKLSLEQCLRLRPALPEALQLQARVLQAEKQVEAQVDRLAALVEQQRWDDALALHQQLADTAADDPRITNLEQRARRGSHDFHLQQARAHVSAGQLDEAAADFRTALDRQDEPATRAELRNVSLRLAVRQAESAQRAGNFEQAHAALETCRKAWGNDPQLDNLSAQVDRRWADQLSAEAKATYSAARPISSPAMEKKYLDALAKLRRAAELAPDAAFETSAAPIRKQLASYYFRRGETRMAVPNAAGAGQACLLFARAAEFDPDLPKAAAATETARQAFRRKAHIEVSVVFRDQSPRRRCTRLARDLEDQIGSAILHAGLPNVQLSEPDAADYAPAAEVQVIGDVLECEAHTRPIDTRVPSQYVMGYRPNREYDRLVEQRNYFTELARKLDKEDDQYGACAEQEKKQGVYGDCRKARDDYNKRWEDARRRARVAEDALARTPAQFPILAPYFYLRRDVTVDAAVRLGYRIVDSATGTRAQQEQLSAQDSRHDDEITHAMAEDSNGVKNKPANIPSAEGLLDTLLQPLRQKIESAALDYLHRSPAKYLARARDAQRAGLTDEAVENYLLFLETTPDSKAPEYTDALQFLREQAGLEYRPIR